ncbi:LysR family transcriptional regulator [Caldimonas thermodepolymerans]|uniref:DNA-binding transcriptional LysR family regulator n=1 Tax=Caldimonas thermodepolymerans TaxID=215580 RepID=A0A2S5T055_9BURK|nr:LysR family transcriptional regulator [Caldimonas thermodepolymerans]PPE68350.1 LysR family transcriptional regulator [Caldimonas thermodepolymerans]QPC31215.1 LysR family transcriptional regulator [Caldimonas thermodepolymerans]RDH96675.1 DNA-binding transcriptional LysR family regulator [Caldimonas thermodepolymerans]TCP04727.1 DNA-binding transcriptional LysR family regulator [Caldimonas thermodepolymerans]UZG47613.1 LysR family transcriptional regulator [Caldimonas thermodepolymerans]
MTRLNIDWLHVFVEVYRLQNVSRAAERLGVAQANVSTALAKLRRHFGDPLFCRTSRGMEPTPYAKQIYPAVVSALQTLDELSGARATFDPATATRQFRIAMTDISEIVVLPTLINHLRRVAPGVTVETERTSLDTGRRLESGEVDLAVGFMPHLEAGFYQQTLFRQDFVCLAARNHPRIHARPTREQFLAEGHIVVTTSGTGHAIVDKVFQAHGWERRIVLKVPSFLGVARLVATTELLVIVPRRLGEALSHQERIAVLDPPVELPPFDVKQHWHERFHLDAGHTWLRATLAALHGK